MNFSLIEDGLDNFSNEVDCRYYSSQLKAWVGDLGDGVHDGSVKDPRIGIIKVKMITATYALQKGTAISRGIEIAKGTVTGSTANTNKLRELHAEEVQKYRSMCTAPPSQAS